MVVAAAAVSAACSHSPSESPRSAVDADIAAGIAAQLGSLPEYESVRAIVVLAEGRTVFERYYDSAATDYWNVASVTKSVLSTLVGIAVAEGQIRLDEPLSQLLPAHASVMKPDVARVTLRQVLTMTAGFSGTLAADDLRFMDEPDWARGVLQRQVRPPGRTFSYSSAGSHLLSAILAARTGMSVLDYARARLFDPLGIRTRPAFEGVAEPGAIDAYERAGFAWPVDPQGRHLGWAYLKLRPVDMAKIGTLYLDGGRWEGDQILPRAWVRDATTAQVATGSGGAAEAYGYQWWVTTAAGDPAFFALGYGGQLIAVVPRRQLVIAVSTEFTLNDPSSSGIPGSLLTNLVDSVVAPAVQPQ